MGIDLLLALGWGILVAGAIIAVDCFINWGSVPPTEQDYTDFERKQLRKQGREDRWHDR